ncbi:MAG TPA: ParB/RepB/Spo0J family partition protein [Candidatus Sulfotelmatobacter sp.]|nr:ParB/RepB/Spo0J family partition protein [Candidatus Sulfotelmatobacter sp.]
MVQKRGLGRGLGALIPTADQPEPLSQEIALDDIQTNPFQPRRSFRDAPLQELAATIRAHGVLTPIVVRRAAGGYQVIAGERRVRAARLAGLVRIPAVIREGSDLQVLEMALVENLQREDLNPIEAAEAYQRLIGDYGLTQEAVAERLGRDRSSVANLLRLLRLPKEIQDDLAAGRLSEGHGRALLGLEKPADQLRCRGLVLKRRLNVRAAEQLVRKLREVTPPARRRAAQSDANLAVLEDRLRARLATKVRIQRSGYAGTVEIHFFSADDLTRVVELILGAG